MVFYKTNKAKRLILAVCHQLDLWRVVWRYLAIGIGLGACVLMTGCQEQRIANKVEQKLDKIHQLPTQPAVMPLADEVVLIADYQAGKDPFISPYRTQASSANHTADKANKADKAEQHTSTQHIKNTERIDTMPPRQEIAKPQTGLPKTDKSVAKLHFGKPISKPTRMQNEPLERYELNALRYQGRVVSQDWQAALIVTPDGMVHQVSVGQYLGRHHGKLSRIDEYELVIVESYADGEVDNQAYYQRTVRLPINQSAASGINKD